MWLWLANTAKNQPVMTNKNRIGRRTLNQKCYVEEAPGNGEAVAL